MSWSNYDILPRDIFCKSDGINKACDTRSLSLEAQQNKTHIIRQIKI